MDAGAIATASDNSGGPCVVRGAAETNVAKGTVRPVKAL